MLHEKAFLGRFQGEENDDEVDLPNPEMDCSGKY